MSKLMEDRMPERKMFLICDARMFQKLLRNNYHRLRFDTGEHSTIPFILKLEVVFSSSDEDWEEQL